MRRTDAKYCPGLLQRETDETRHNVEVFVNAPDLQTAKPQLKKVNGPPTRGKCVAGN